MGVALAKEGSLEGARKELIRAVELAPNSGAAHFALARLLYFGGDYNGAPAEALAARNAGDVDVPSSFIEVLARKAHQ